MWAKSEFDYTIENNGSLENLTVRVDDIIRQLQDLPPTNEAA